MTHSQTWRATLDQLRSAQREILRRLSLLDDDEIHVPCHPDGPSPHRLMADLCHHYSTVAREARREWDGSTIGANGASSPAPDDMEALMVMARDAFQRMLDALTAPAFPEAGPPELLSRCDALAREMLRAADSLKRRWTALDRWGRARFTDFIAAQFDALLDSVGGLREESLCGIAVEGPWTARDLLAHVLCWEEYGWEILHQWPEASTSSLEPWLFDDMHQGNAILLQAKSHYGLIDVLGDLYTYRRRTVTFLKECPDERLMSTGRMGRTAYGLLTDFLLEMAAHRSEHAQSIWDARQQGILT